jgi:6-pyruvoyltetrahydropterin/6-carboxytetrahydropterin synthase
MKYTNTKIIELGSCAFRQWRADSHCKFIHGYRLVAKFWFCCNRLDEKDWVVDFGGLKNLKTILENQFDHTLCIADDDPLLAGFKSLHAARGCDLRIMPGGVGIEKTAEWCLKVADAHIRDMTENRCWVERVEVWEHDKNSAIVELMPTAVTVQAPGNTVAASVQPPPNVPEINRAKQVFDFLEDVREETGINLQQVLKNPPMTGPRPAPVGNQVTTGFSNLFSGTSWGS